MAQEQEQSVIRRRTPVSARLPQVALNDAVVIAQALFDLAGPASAPLLAQHMKVSAASSGFKQRLAAAGYFGIVNRNGAKYELAALGHGLTAGDAASKRASGQMALMSSNFGRLISQLSGRTVNQDTIAARLQTDLEVPAASALPLAKALIASAEQAGVLTDGRFDAKAIEETLAALPEPLPESVVPHAPTQRKPDSSKKGPVAPRPNGKVTGDQQATRLPFSPSFPTQSLGIHLELNVSHLSVDEIVALVKKLKLNPEESG